MELVTTVYSVARGSGTCHTLHNLEYRGFIASIDDSEVSTGRSHLEFTEVRSLPILCHDDMVPLLQLHVWLVIPMWE